MKLIWRKKESLNHRLFLLILRTRRLRKPTTRILYFLRLSNFLAVFGYSELFSRISRNLTLKAVRARALRTEFRTPPHMAIFWGQKWPRSSPTSFPETNLIWPHHKTKVILALFLPPFPSHLFNFDLVKKIFKRGNRICSLLQSKSKK